MLKHEITIKRYDLYEISVTRFISVSFFLFTFVIGVPGHRVRYFERFRRQGSGRDREKVALIWTLDCPTSR